MASMVEDGKPGRVTKTFTTAGVLLVIVGAFVLWQSLAALEPEEARWGWRVGNFRDRMNGEGYVSFHLFTAALALAAMLLGVVIAFAARLTFVSLLAEATRSELKHVRLGHRLLEERVGRLEQAAKVAERLSATATATSAAEAAAPAAAATAAPRAAARPAPNAAQGSGQGPTGDSTPPGSGEEGKP